MRIYSATILLALLTLYGAVGTIIAQESNSDYPETLDIGEKTGVPVVIMHLPNWESVKNSAKIAVDKTTLLKESGNHAVLSNLDFPSDTEAAIASYPEGNLVLIEYSSAQNSIDADNRTKQFQATNPNEKFVYRRIGNYNAYVFDAKDDAAAGALLDQIKYQKVVRWLNGDPYSQQRAEHGFVSETKSLLFSTALAILIGLGGSLVVGVFAGYVFFHVRQRGRARISAHTDGGGLTRLNLDSITPEMQYRGFLRGWGFKEDSQ